MTLEDVIKKGKREAKVGKVRDEFGEDNSMNVVSRLTQEIGQLDNLVECGFNPAEDLVNHSPSFNRHVIDYAYQSARSELAKEVQADYNAAAGAITSGEEGPARVARLLSSIKPKDDLTVSEDVKKAHKNAYKATQYLNDPRKGFENALEGVKDKSLRYALNLAARGNEKLMSTVVLRRASVAQTNFAESLRESGNPGSYMDSMYAASDDRGKEEIAYGIGKAVTLLESK